MPGRLPRHSNDVFAANSATASMRCLLFACFLAAAGFAVWSFGTAGSRDIRTLKTIRQINSKVLSSEQTAQEDSGRELHIQSLLDSLASRERRESFTKIFSSNYWGDQESRSGYGSTIAYTENVRKLLSHAIRTYNISQWTDAPCGDCNWQPYVEGIDGVQYLGLDIVPGLIEHNAQKYAGKDNMQFRQLDFVSDPFPSTSGMILCRDMIQHNSLEDGVRAYYNMEKSGAQYLVTTWHNQGESNNVTYNVNVQPGGMYDVNVFLHPFNFSRPEFFISEGSGGLDPYKKVVGLFKLPALGMGDGYAFDISEHVVQSQSEIVSVT